MSDKLQFVVRLIDSGFAQKAKGRELNKLVELRSSGFS
jgi:hypothetical protein